MEGRRLQRLLNPGRRHAAMAASVTPRAQNAREHPETPHRAPRCCPRQVVNASGASGWGPPPVLRAAGLPGRSGRAGRCVRRTARATP